MNICSLKNPWKRFVLTKCEGSELEESFFSVESLTFWSIWLIRQKGETQTVIFLTKFVALHLCPDWIGLTSMQCIVEHGVRDEMQIGISLVFQIFGGCWEKLGHSISVLKGFILPWLQVGMSIYYTGKFSAVMVIPQENRQAHISFFKSTNFLFSMPLFTSAENKELAIWLGRLFVLLMITSL